MQKLVSINVPENQLDTQNWEKIKNHFSEIVFKKNSDDDLLEELKEAEAIFSKFNQVSKEMIEATLNLKYIGVFATGYGKVDLNIATTRGITVTNVPGYSTESVAEFTIGALLEYLREIGRARNEASKGNYDESIYSASEIKGKTFGVLGLGRIGRRVAELANAFGAKVKYNSKTDKKVTFAEYISIEKLFTNSDIISINCSLNEETELMLDKAVLKKIKTGTIIINTSPMELFNFNDLLNTLKSKDIIFIWDHSDEMSEENLSKLKKLENCITYPPVGYISKEASKSKKEIFVQNIEKFIEGNPINKVN